MFTRTRIALALTLIALPGAISAQQQEQPSEEVRTLLQEAAQIQQQLAPVQQQALGDEAVQQGQQQAADALRAAMIEMNPEMAASIERLEAIMQEAQLAQATGDQETIASLTQEAQQLQPQVMEAQAKALDHPDVQPRVAAFQKQLQDKMVELDPDAAPLLERLSQIEEALEKASEGRG
jgi:23S rRNA G2445 N2-methylase RlmL